MKNILTFLTLLTLFFSVGWAETAEFDVLLGGFTDGENCFYKTVNGITLTFAKGTGQNLPNITGGTMGGDAHVVFHRGNTITVEGGTSTITEVELSFYIYQPGESWGVSSGSYSVTQINSSWTGTWTGAAPTVTLTNNSEQNANIFHVKVTYRPKVQTPVITINPDAATHYVGDNVTASIACGTADATILYKINDGEWTECNGSVNFTSETPGNVTIQAIAKKDGCNNSEVAEKTITFVPIPVLNNLAEVNALKDGDKFKFEADITASPVVLGKRNNDLYIVMPDNSAGALVYKAGVYWDDTYTYGKIINSGWTGEKTTYNGRPEVRNTENFSVSDVSSDLVAIQILSNSDLSLRNFGRFAVIKGVKVAPAGSFNELTTYDEFGVMSQVVDEGKYDVSGVIGWENGTGVFMPLWYNNYEPAHTITVTQPVGGTISADIDKAYSGERVNLTANPAAAYQFGSWIVKDENDNGVAVTENHFTMPKSDVTVTAQFTLKPTYAITVEGGTANPTAAYEGQTVTVTPTIPEGKLFDSYTVTPNSVTLTESGNGYTFTMPAEPVTVTFNYKDDPAWTNHFERITSTDQLVAGVRYLLVYETRPAVLGGIVGDNPKYGSAVTSSSDFSYNNGVVNLTSNSAAMPVILGGATGAWTFKTGGKYLYSATGGGLNTQEANNNNGIWSISFEGSNAVITNHNGETSLTIYYNDSKQGFAGYSSTSSGQALHPIQLYKETIPPVVTWTVAGSSNELFGTTWDPTLTANDMTLVDGLYTWSRQGVELPFGTYEFKVVKDHAWGVEYPTENYKFNICQGKYNITITFNESTHEVNAIVELVEYKDVFTVVGDNSDLFGTTWDVNNTANKMTTTDGKILTLTKTVSLAAGVIKYKAVRQHDYNQGQWPNGNGNNELNITSAGDYRVTFTLNLSSSELTAEATKLTPDVPTFSPEGGTYNVDQNVTISCVNEGATIYYTTDDTDPTTNSTVYSEPITVTGDGTHTIKAIAVKDGYASPVAEATYTIAYDRYSVAGAKNGVSAGGQDDPFFGKTWKADDNYMSTDDHVNFTWTSPYVQLNANEHVDFKVVKNNSQWIGNGEANIVCTAPEDGTYVLKVTYNASSGVVGSELIKKVDAYTIAGSAIGETIEAGHGKEDALFGTAWEPTLTANDMTLVDGLYTWSKTGVELDYGTLSYGNIAFRICEDHSLDHTYPVGGADRIITTVGSGVYDVTITFNPETKEIVAIATAHVSTLKDLCLTGKNGGNYVIEESLLGVYKKDNTVWFKDDNKFANPDVYNSTDNNFEIKVADGDMWHSKDATFDQSNWIEVEFPADATGINYENVYVKNLTGVFTNVNGNPKLTITTTDGIEEGEEPGSYTPNRYCIANFKGTQAGHYTNNGSKVECTYFFVTPKPQEYAEIIFAVYNDGKLSMPSEAYTNNGVSGTVTVDLSKNGTYEPVNGTVYSGFNVIVSKVSRSSMLKAEGDYTVSPVNMTDADIPTAISTVGVNGEVKSVKYVSVAGVVSERPFQGVNIVVTEYTDGSRTTTKVVK